MGATLLGSLLVSLGLDSAEFDKGVSNTKKQTRSLTDTFTASGKEIAASADKMGVSFGQFTAKVRALQTTLDPAGAALKTYRNEVRLLQEAYKLGAVSQDQFKAGMQSAVATYRQSSSVLATTNRQSRFGLQDLGFQLSDVATQFAGGSRAAVIFAQQGPQIVQAVQLMSGSTGRFASFMGGPWGVALMVGVSVLGALAAKFFETKDASAEAEKATKSFSDVLGDSKSSWQDVTKAAKDYADQLKKNREITINAIGDEARLTKERLGAAIALREKLKAELDEKVADLKATQRTAFPSADAAAGFVQQQANALADVQARIDANNQALTNLTKASNEVVIKAADEIAKVNNDAAHKLETGFNLMLDQARNTLRGAALIRRETVIEAQRQAAMKELQDSQRTDSDTREKSSFIFPVSGRVTGTVGEQRPGHTHAGIDLAVPVGTAVKAPAGGVVIESGTLPGYGNVVFIDHGGGTISRLAHLSQLGVIKGQTVDQGDVIGLSGGAKGMPGAGNSQGPHVHYEVRVNGRPVDPRKGPFPIDPMGVAAKAGDAAERAQREAERLADKENRDAKEFADQSAAVDGALLQAKRANVTDAGQLAQIARDEVENERQKLIADIEAKAAQNPLIAARKDELEAAINQTAAQKLITINSQEAVRLSRQRLDRYNDEADRQRELLQIQSDFADSQAERKRIALEILDLEYRQKKAALEAAILAEKDVDEKQRLQDKRDALIADHGINVAAVARQNETPRERFMRDLNPSASALSEQIDEIKIDGLNSLNDQLADAIIHFKSLGDVAKNVFQGIAADLLRLEIRKTLIAPLAQALGLGGSTKIGGNTKGLESNFDSILGGGSASLTAAGTTLSTAGAGLNAAAAQLQVAAARLGTGMTPGSVSGGGGFLKGLLSVAGAVAGSINFGGAATAGANAVGKSVVGGAHAALKMFADGTNFAPGGLALVGERGPELVNVRRGSQIIPNHELKNLAANDRAEIHRPTFVFPGVTNAKEAREAGGQAARRYRRELSPMRVV